MLKILKNMTLYMYLLSIYILLHVGMDLKSDDMSTTAKTADTYHKIIEAMKFAYADRKLLGDPDYDNVTLVSSELTGKPLFYALQC